MGTWRRVIFVIVARGVSILVVLDWAWGRSVRYAPKASRPWFQSLLYWIGRGDLHAAEFCLKYEFQSLLYWIGRGDAINAVTSRRSAVVSILVVLDWAWGRTCPGPENSTHRRFNPCCIGLGVGTSLLSPVLAAWFAVSILVVLDWAWGPSPSRATGSMQNCFNPCCIGLGVGTGEDLSGVAKALGFQSLLYWIGRGDLLRCGRSDCGSEGFQSLLYWIGRGDSITNALNEPVEGVSILVVLDWAWGHDQAPSLIQAALTFQSLLYWIGRGDDDHAPSLIQAALSFNPCCIGLGVGTRSRRRQRWLLPMVSILVVLDWAWGRG